jgi:hypothetical protein
MKMNRRSTAIFLRAVFAVLALSGLLAASASAAPAWKFNGESLAGQEVILGAAIDSSMTIPGLTTKCENFLYKLTIENSAGTGKGSVTELPLYNCTTSSKVCSVKTINAETLPWAAKLTTVTSKNYIVVEGIKVGIIYSGAQCAVNGTLVVVKGTAGGLTSNETETATFDAASFTATGTKLSALGSSVEWKGVFPTEAFQWHREQALSIS